MPDAAPATHPKAALVERLARHIELTLEDEQTLSSLETAVVALAPGQLLDTSQKDCGLLLRGFTCKQGHAASGRQILTIQLPGDLINADALLVDSSYEFEALGLADVLVFDRAQLRHAMDQSPRIAQAIGAEVALDLSIVGQWVINVGRRDAMGRVAHLLAELGVRWQAAGLGKKDHFQLPLTQEQMSDCIGATTHYTNKVLMRLDAEGLIRRDRRTVQILDWNGICERGEFTAEYLQLPMQQ